MEKFWNKNTKPWQLFNSELCIWNKLKSRQKASTAPPTKKDGEQIVTMRGEGYLRLHACLRMYTHIRTPSTETVAQW